MNTKGTELHWVGWSVILAIAVGIWQSIPELESAIEYGQVTLAYYDGSLWVKAVKDIIVFCLWLVLVIVHKDDRTQNTGKYVLTIYIVTGFAFFVGILQSGFVIALAGLRWIAPLLLFVEFRRIRGRFSFGPVLLVFLFVAIVLNLIQQVTNLFTFQPFFGVRWGGYPNRVPGFFLMPNSTAFFSCACSAVIINSTLQKSRVLPILALLCSAASAVLAQSGAGIVACFLLGLFTFFRKVSTPFVLITMTTSLFVGFLDTLIGRDDFLEISGGERLEKLVGALGELLGFGSFGLYTNAGYMIKTLRGDLQGRDLAVISDSFYASLVGNLGLPSILVIYCLYKIGKTWFSNNPGRGMAVLLCMIAFSFSTVITEAFPMNLLLIAGSWSMVRTRDGLATGVIQQLEPGRASEGSVNVSAIPTTSSSGSAGFPGKEVRSQG
jgi:hypothetical protein